MKFSKLLAPTLKEAPKDALLPSHIYLVRGGFIYQVASGVYDFLPLGKKVLDKVRSIIKDELDSAGCQEVQLGFVTPSELWEKSGRYEKYGAELLRFKDRKSNEFVLGQYRSDVLDYIWQNIPFLDELPFFKPQKRWVLKNCGISNGALNNQLSKFLNLNN